MSRRRTSRKPAWRTEVETAAADLVPFQIILSRAADAAGRKAIVMVCREAGALSGEAATLLLQSYQLETA